MSLLLHLSVVKLQFLRRSFASACAPLHPTIRKNKNKRQSQRQSLPYNEQRKCALMQQNRDRVEANREVYVMFLNIDAKTKAECVVSLTRTTARNPLLLPAI